MFGYVKPAVGELKVKEYEFYESVYCGLCRSMKKVSKFLPFSLSYDFVFLALARMSVNNESPCFFSCRCLARPFSKHTCVSSLPSMDYSCKASLILSAYKIFDDRNDSKGLKKLYYSILSSKMKRLLKKSGDPKLEKEVKERIESLSIAEKSLDFGLYECADIFGNLLSSIFSYRLEGEKSKEMRNIGYHIGRWIYIVDAYADIKEDLKNKNYNPFIELTEDTHSDDFKKMLRDSLLIELDSAKESFKIFSESSDEGIRKIIENVLYIGMPTCAENVIFKNMKVGKNEKHGKEHIHGSL